MPSRVYNSFTPPLRMTAYDTSRRNMIPFARRTELRQLKCLKNPPLPPRIPNHGALLSLGMKAKAGERAGLACCCFCAATRRRSYGNNNYARTARLLRTMQEIFGVSPWLGDADQRHGY